MNDSSTWKSYSEPKDFFNYPSFWQQTISEDGKLKDSELFSSISQRNVEMEDYSVIFSPETEEQLCWYGRYGKFH